MQELKYKKKIDNCACDFDDFKERERTSYRWCFSEISDERNFLPKYLRKPDEEDDNCLGWGLSFFNTLEEGKQRLNEVVGLRTFLYKKLGDHIAIGELSKEDGISNKSDRTGHFTLFEYKNVDLSKKFEVVEKVI
jgi:hypothetical protein